MKTMIGLPEAMVHTFVADVPMPKRPYVDPVTREALDLLFECDRIDAMSGSEAQQVAMTSLLARVQEFEAAVPGSVQRAVLGDALAVLS
ncbi:MAG: hypothetical protein ACO36I_04125 [Candidatus Latescibacterota bacterium]